MSLTVACATATAMPATATATAHTMSAAGTTFIYNFSSALIEHMCDFLDVERVFALYLAMPEKMQYMKVIVTRRINNLMSIPATATEYTALSTSMRLLKIIFDGNHMSALQARDLVDNQTLYNMIYALPTPIISPIIAGILDWSKVSIGSAPELVEVLHQFWVDEVISSGCLLAATCYYDLGILLMPGSRKVVELFKNLYERLAAKNTEATAPVFLLKFLAHIWSKKYDGKTCLKKCIKVWHYTMLMLRRYLTTVLEAHTLYAHLIQHTDLTEASATDLVLYSRKK